jgi:hypothetical protein
MSLLLAPGGAAMPTYNQFSSLKSLDLLRFSARFSCLNMYKYLNGHHVEGLLLSLKWMLQRVYILFLMFCIVRVLYYLLECN